MRSNEEIVVGEKMFVSFIHENKPPFEATINTSGRIYFTFTELPGRKFRIADLSQKESTYGHSQTYKVWHSRSQYNGYQDETRLRILIKSKLSFLNRETLLKIAALIT